PTSLYPLSYTTLFRSQQHRSTRDGARGWPQGRSMPGQRIDCVLEPLPRHGKQDRCAALGAAPPALAGEDVYAPTCGIYVLTRKRDRKSTRLNSSHSQI